MDIDIIGYRYEGVSGRYVTTVDLERFYLSLSGLFEICNEGKSVENRDVKSVRVGSGDKKIFMWSQMHGNESTTTKAVLDLLMFLDSGNGIAKSFLDAFTLLIIPIVNPDGAFVYTRVNANGVDLNRDAVDLSQPESKILRRLFDEFSPDFAFNLHDQRTIFGVGNEEYAASLSFLSPSFDEHRSLNATRERAMQLIVGICNVLRNHLPNGIARFDDGFNLNCVGDYFQYRGVPTVLLEAGHYKGDYSREVVRGFVFRALIAALSELESNSYVENDVSNYFLILENNKSYVDVVLRKVLEPLSGVFWTVSLQYEEVLCNDHILFLPIITEISKKESKFAHVCVNSELKFIGQVSDLNRLIGEKAFEIIDFGSITVNDLLKKQ